MSKAINKALDLRGVTDPQARANWMKGYLVLTNRESTYNGDAINPDGLGATGAAQCKPATYAAYHQPGTTTNILDPVSNIAASMNYVSDRYNVRADGANLAARVQQADPTRPPAGY